MIKISTAILTFALSMTIFSTTVQADQTVSAQKEWTFLVYINGHNNLDPFGSQNIKGMEKVGSSDQLNIVVQWASEANQDTRRLLIKKDTSGSSDVISPVVQSINPRVDMGDYKSLIDFVKWGVQNYPAKHYFVAVWNHGNGWELQSMSGGSMHANDISWDDLSGNHITTEQLGVAMGEIAKVIGHKLDIYGSDACLMAMAEVAGEMKDSVSVFAGSQETEPGQGWPYETFLAHWAAQPTMTAQQVGKTLSNDYTNAYSGGIYGTQDVTFSAFDMANYGAVVDSVKKLAAELQGLNTADIGTVQTAMNNTQAFYTSDYKDLYDFVLNVESSRASIQSATLANTKKAIESFVIATDSTHAYKNAHGLSVWMPSSYDYSNNIKRYTGLQFDKATGWSGFLGKLP